MTKKAQCVYCGKIIYYIPGFGYGPDEMYEDEKCRIKVNRLERCPHNRTNSRELGTHKYNALY